MYNDLELVSKQLNRPLMTSAVTMRSCDCGFPMVTRNEPITSEGHPFPTLYWLTCPALRTAVARIEAVGGLRRFELALSRDPRLRAALSASERNYKRERALIGNHRTASHKDVGIAGTGDPTRLKCLHAHVADYLATGTNPIGRKVLDEIDIPGSCDRCSAL